MFTLSNVCQRLGAVWQRSTGVEMDTMRMKIEIKDKYKITLDNYNAKN